MRYMVMHKVDANMEAGERPSEELIQNMGKLVGRSLNEGIFKDGAGLHRSAMRVRLEFAGGKRTVVRGPYKGSNELLASLKGVRTHVAAGKRVWFDGPFAESKELVAGYSILDVPSIAEAKAFTEEYVGILCDVEVDIREVA